ncbi:MAG: pilus assembly protein PilM [Deltaproteobacteria bacterium]|nr:pilus assembly protein PilM [Deltaproteobacteria bacterium]
MLKLKSTYPIGLDIGNQHIYAAQFKKSRHGLAVRGMWHKKLNAEVDNLADAHDILCPLFKEIAKSNKFRGNKVIVHPPFQDISTFPIRFRMSEGDDLEELIVRESKKYMPFPIEEAVIDYPSISSVPSSGHHQYTVTIVASRKDRIEHYLNMLKKAGLSAEIIDFSVSALLRLHHVLFTPSENPIVLGNIGHTESLLSIVTKEDILAQRMVTWGIQPLVDKLRVNFEHLGEEHKARILLTNYGLRYEDRLKSEKRSDISEKAETDSMLKVIYQLVTPHIEELIHECHKLMAYVRSETQNPKFDAVYMYGLANMIGNLDGYMQNRLQLPTTLVNPIKENGFQNSGMFTDVSDGADFALALGLAMKKVTWP